MHGWGCCRRKYGEKGSRVLDGIRDTYLKKGEQGWELHGICASAGLGPGPDNRTDRTGTPEYYLSESRWWTTSTVPPPV